MRDRVDELLLAVARVGQAHVAFGQLYESVVDVPGRIAREPLTRARAASSPARYFVPAAPIARAALVAGVVRGYRHRGRRARLGVAALAAVGETAVTVHLVRHVNTGLFVAGQQAPEDQRPRLLRRWHRLNAVRLVAGAVVWTALAADRRAATGPRAVPAPTRRPRSVPVRTAERPATRDARRCAAR